MYAGFGARLDFKKEPKPDDGFILMMMLSERRKRSHLKEVKTIRGKMI